MHSKLQRWTDLLAALLTRQFPASFEELAREVPAYAAALDPEHRDSVKRTFERDKDELREFGVPIETVVQDDAESTGYRLRPARFYLPYLTAADVALAATRPRAEGYRALGELRFEPDEIAVVAESVARLEQLGDPQLTEDARSAARKLAFDLPLFGAGRSDVALLGDDHALPETFDTLGDALRRRKAVSFHYRAPASTGATERHVDPYGLFFVSAHWYLAAYDRTRDGVRNFRLSRMSDVAVNRKRPQSADYAVPTQFRLRDHARSRTAWDLGEGEPQLAEVRFTGTSGAVATAARAGEPVSGSDTDAGSDSSDGSETVRRFPVRRPDVFARWLLSFGGDAQPVSPPSLVAAYRALASETLACYEGDEP